jgi:hypothetical protein
LGCDLVVILVFENLIDDEVHKSLFVVYRLHRGNSSFYLLLIWVENLLEKVLSFLLVVPLLKIVNYSDMIDLLVLASLITDSDLFGTSLVPVF